MHSALVLRADPTDRTRAVRWLRAELARAGCTAARLERLVRGLEAHWSALVARLYPRRRSRQMLLLELTAAGPAIDVALCGEGGTPRRSDPCRCDMDGLRRLDLAAEIAALPEPAGIPGPTVVAAEARVAPPIKVLAAE